MTEQEIIDFLKKNKETGIAFMFMPKEVRNWVSENYNNPKLLYFTQKAEWKSFDKIDDDYDNVVVFALPDDYEVKEESKGGWVEFEIDQKGNFHCFKDDDMHYFFWANWNIFLKAFSDEFTAFGGWQYKNCKAWFLQPMLSQDDIYIHSEFEGETCDCKPAIPIKVRFWREVK